MASHAVGILAAALLLSGGAEALLRGAAPGSSKLGCRHISLLSRGDPADSETIEGDDCGNVKQIVGKWAHAKEVGGLAGKAEAAKMGAELASKNTEAAANDAEAVGKKVGLKGEVPEGVKLAVKEAKEASKKAGGKATDLGVTVDTFKGKMGEFSEDVSNDDLVKLKKETTEAIEASGDAKDAAERVLAKAAEAKKDAMKNADSALAMIKDVTGTAEPLVEKAVVIGQKSTHAAEDAATLVKKADTISGKLKDKAADAKEQKPVWEAMDSDLKGRADAVTESEDDVKEAVKNLDKAADALKGKSKSLKETALKATGDPKKALGQSKNLDEAEEAVRKTEAELDILKGKVTTLMGDVKNLDKKIKESEAKLK